MVLTLQHILIALIQFFRRGQQVFLRGEEPLSHSDAFQVGQQLTFSPSSSVSPSLYTLFSVSVLLATAMWESWSKLSPPPQ